MTTIAVDDLIELLERREQYAIPPEQTLELLTRPGSFQDDRLDLLDENIQDRVKAGETLWRSFELSNGLTVWLRPQPMSGGSSGMQDSDDVPSERDVKNALQLLGIQASASSNRPRRDIGL